MSKESASHRQTWGGETIKKANILSLSNFERVTSSVKKRNEMSKGALQGDDVQKRGGRSGGSGSNCDGQYYDKRRIAPKQKRGPAHRQFERQTKRRKKGEEKTIRSKQSGRPSPVEVDTGRSVLPSVPSGQIYEVRRGRKEQKNEKGKMPPGRSCKARRAERKTRKDTRRERGKSPPATDPFRPK